MINDGIVGTDFKRFYLQFWKENCCEFYEVVNCEAILFGSLKEGTDQIICYINRKFDEMLKMEFQNKSTIYNSLSAQNIVDLQINYVKLISGIN